ncbi:glycoside hydrolase family 75 protein [Labrenzia sp. DG1229]|uniref:glycoside hydrolase family 75 protein n=1 Tax=Labrenzia sp. DG1229 TaxID=681847 RepID=UPI0004901DE5|nr:glycoside hydrolase family 75 protein [Labrenzia sp. DG1229]
MFKTNFSAMAFIAMLAISPTSILAAECEKADEFEIGATTVTLQNDALFFTSHMHADADGSARAYHSKYLRGPHDKTKPKNVLVQDTICNGASYYRRGKKIPGIATAKMCAKHYGRECVGEERYNLYLKRCLNLVGDIKKAQKNNWRKPKIDWFGVAHKNVDGRVVPCIHKTGVLKDYFVSQTSLPNEPTADACSGKRYMNSETIPFIVLPRIKKTKKSPVELRCEFRKHGVKKGDIVAVYSKKYQKLVFAIYADNGPGNKLGEGSLNLGWELRGTQNDEKTDASSAVVTGEVRYLVFPGSATGAPYSFAGIQKSGQQLLEEWGDLETLLETQH